MPPLPRLQTKALADLAEQLRYAPRTAILRDVVRAEELAGDVEPDQPYPVEWVVFRVSGYRPELGHEQTVGGLELLRDLSAFVERLCAQAKLRAEEHADGELVSIDSLVARWGVSRSTINRHRRRGLVARRVLGADGRPRLAFREDVVDRYERRHGAEIERAASYTRLDEAQRREIIRRAERYRRSLGLSLNEAALRLARRFDRSHEAVRQILRRHDGRAGAPIFAEPGPLSDRQRRAIERGVRRGIEPGVVARRFGRSASLVRRVVADVRAQRLHGLLDAGLVPRPDDPEFDESAPASAHARSGLSPACETDLLALVSIARTQGPPAREREAALAAAYRVLCGRAHVVISALPEHGASSAAVDRAETDLRWAGLLKLALARDQLGTVLRAIEDRTEQRAEQLGSSALGELLLAGLGALGGAIDHFRPRRGGRLAGAVAVAVDRALVRHRGVARVRERSPGAATGRLVSHDVGDWRPTIVRWLPAIGPDPRIERVAGELDPERRALLAARYGLAGAPPRTLAEIAAERGREPMHVARREREALRAAFAAARARSEHPPALEAGGVGAGSG